MATRRGLKRKYVVFTVNGKRYWKPILNEKGKLLINGITYNEEAWRETVDKLKTLS